MSICPQSEELSPPSLFTVVRGQDACAVASSSVWPVLIMVGIGSRGACASDETLCPHHPFEEPES